ncbi:PDR/VanB family oxidoreductase [Nesterenkonia flava]|uniref:PDR/VanB family oxidoreductase n=1 Tax=Nesterenkonia flava TaxID=469799 RepID=A0ABU1FUC0_9MICC|nr:PDR/VanB family oxidoreductase [Nesterenkonia flava]MDR5712269.1 PDR/VanB family oxidoreductase [Nesterenkonia flava]
MNITRELEITGISETAPEVRTLTLAAPDRSLLPSFVPGSHLVLECGERANAYSLTSDPLSPQSYRISVLRLRDGQGGSAWLHRRGLGERLRARPPRSAFAPQLSARKHLLIAGGIGVTPILSLVRAARQWGHAVEVLYVHRPGYGAHCEELHALAPGSVRCLSGREAFLADFERTVRTQPVGTHLYCCGPEAFMDSVQQSASAAGWPEVRIHTERFGVGALEPGEPFEVELTDSQQRLTVPSGVSLLEALEKQGFTIPNLCRQGVCGECVLPVSRGSVLHRDHYLTEAEKEAGDSMMCCVSRAAPGSEGPIRLEIPL